MEILSSQIVKAFLFTYIDRIGFMNALKSAPPSTDGRIFIGGLSDVVTKAALVALLEPFGQACNVERHPRGFAHVTLHPDGDSTIDRCVSTLNRTMWRGSVLRVELAREHFAHRLRREWQDNGDVLDSDGLDIATKNSEAKFSFHPSSTGKHLYFDIADDTDVAPFNNVSDVVKDDSNCSPMPSSVQSSADLTPEKLAGTGARSSAVVSTLSLFGLNVQSILPQHTLPPARTSTPPPKSSSIPTEKKRSAAELSLSTAPVKHSRTERNSPNIDLARACAVENDARLIDIDVERKAALSVLQSMFPKEDLGLHGSNDVVKFNDTCSDSLRRNGLYRNLSCGAKQIGEHTKAPLTNLYTYAASNQFLQFRRKGLYKKLSSSQ